MGITGFGVWLNNIQRARIKEGKLPLSVSSLFIDMNNVFHDAASDVFLYSKKYNKMSIDRKNKILKDLKKKTEEEKIFLVATRVIEMLYELLKTIQPKEYLVMAVDGVAPMAKITQQRKRRFKAAKERAVAVDPDEEELDDLKTPGSEKLLTGVFDSNCITPGTKFMQLMDQYLQRFIDDALKMRTNIFPEKIVYSSHLTPGEGEHKFFEMIRSGQIKIESIGANVVYGLDADLTMLTLLSDVPYFYLYKQGYNNFGKLEVNIVNIDALKEFIFTDLNILNDPVNQIDMETTTRDFVVMVYFVGNDFLPHISAFEDVAAAINKMFEVYQELNKPLTKPSGEVLWENFKTFMSMLSIFEQPFLKQMAAQSYQYPFTILDESVTKTYPKIDEGTFGNANFQNRVQVDLNFDKFKDLWYGAALEPITDKGKQFMEKHKIEGVPFTQMGVLDMGYEYIKGIQWILHYYRLGTKNVSSKFVYTYHHAPTLTDLATMCDYIMKIGRTPTIDDVKFSPSDPHITPIHQLICVLPPVSWNFIPEPFRGLMLTRFADLSPVDFKIEMEGIHKNKEFMGIPMLSMVDPVRIVNELQDYDIPKEYRDRLPYFVKNIKKVFVPFKILSFEQLQKQKEREEQKASEEYSGTGIDGAKPYPPVPLATMTNKIDSIDTKRKTIKFEIGDRVFHRTNIFSWKKIPLM
jgi:5'-3' exoribonuclease 1